MSGIAVKVGRAVLVAMVVALLFVIPLATAQTSLGGSLSGSVSAEPLSAVDTGATSAQATGLVENVAGSGGVDVDALAMELSGLAGSAAETTPAEGVSAVGGAHTTQSGDATPIAPSGAQLAAASAAAVATAGGFGALFWLQNVLGFGLSRFLVAPLFSRIDKDEILDNEGRELLHSLVAANPGVGLKELATQSGLGWGTTVYHLGRLEQAGLVVSLKNGQNRHFFKNGHPAARSKKAVAVLKNQTAGDMARFLLATPGATQSAIASGLGLKAPVVTKYVKRLEGEGLVAVVPAGRSKIVQATPQLADVMLHVEAPAPAVGVTTNYASQGVAIAA